MSCPGDAWGEGPMNSNPTVKPRFAAQNLKVVGGGRIVFDLLTDFGHYRTLLVRDCSIVGTDAKSANLYGPSRFRDGRYRVLVSLPGHWHYAIKSTVFHALAESANSE